MASDGRRPCGSTGLTPPAAGARTAWPAPSCLQHLHGRNVERLGQRRADRDRAVPVLVEVLRHVDAEARRPVLDQRLGMGQARLEGQAVDEGLQGRARRAHGVRHVDGAEAGVVEIARRADVRDHLAGAMVDGDHGGRQPAAERRRRSRARAARGWPAPCSRGSGGAPCGPCAARPRRRRDAAPAWETRAAPIGTRSAMARAASSREITPAASMRASTRLRARCAAVRKAVGAAHLGRLRQGDQQRRLADRQPPRLLAEVGERGRAHALQVAAERRQPQVEPQDLVLRQPPLELAAPAAPGGSCRPRALVLAEQQARHLHGQGRAAGDDAPVAQQLPAGPPDRQRIDAVMRRKRLSSKAISMAR